MLGPLSEFGHLQGSDLAAPRSVTFEVCQAAGYKAEVIHRRGPWRSFEAVKYVTLEWVDWFNNRRLLEPIGNIPPAEAEEHYYAMLDDQPMAA